MTIKTQIKTLKGDKAPLYVYELDASDNAYLITYASENYADVIYVYELLEGRLTEHLTNKKDFITSDIDGMLYIKK